MRTPRFTSENEGLAIVFGAPDACAEDRGGAASGKPPHRSVRRHSVSDSKGWEKRPSFARLAKDAAQGKLDIVASWSIDRIGRRIGHLVEFMDELRHQGVGIYLHQQQVDSGSRLLADGWCICRV